MKVSNRSVPHCWANGESVQSHTGNFYTDGTKLYSYNLCIGDTTEKGVKVLRDYTARAKWGFQSQTTSCHVGFARRYADIIDN